MATRDQLVEAVLREYERYTSDKPAHTYNTGYDGRWNKSQEAATMADLEYAAAELKTKVTGDFGSSHSVRTAASYSGHAHNEWSILIEVAGKSQAVFNFHMAVLN